MNVFHNLSIELYTIAVKVHSKFTTQIRQLWNTYPSAKSMQPEDQYIYIDFLMLGRRDSNEDQHLQFIVNLHLQVLNVSKYVECGK